MNEKEYEILTVKEAIKLWADGHELEYFNCGAAVWVLVGNKNRMTWDLNSCISYRKAEVKSFKVSSNVLISVMQDDELLNMTFVQVACQVYKLFGFEGGVLNHNRYDDHEYRYNDVISYREFEERHYTKIVGVKYE